MLVIRKTQLAMFRRERKRSFIADMAAYLVAEYPTHCAGLTSAQVRAFVERSIAAAKELRITTEGAVGVLTELRLIYGENLERSPEREWARNILKHERLPGHIKVEAVQNRLLEGTGGRVLVPFLPPS